MNPVRVFANLLLVASLILGAIAAANAYYIRPDDLVAVVSERAEAIAAAEAARAAAPEEDVEVPLQPKLTANAALLRPNDDDPDDPQVEVIVPTDTRLTPELAARIRESGVAWARINEFHFEHWEWRWWFVLGCAGLAVAAAILRTTGKQAGVAPTAAGAPEGSPMAMLESAVRRVHELRANVEAEGNPDARLEMIRREIDSRIAPPLDDFVESRNRLLRSLGMARFAQIMDPLAEAQRYLNRAWSAAVDGVHDESIDSLAIAAESFDRTLTTARELSA